MQDRLSIVVGLNPGGVEDDIYYYYDNANLITMGNPDDGVLYTLESGNNGDPLENFENMIVNENVQTIRRPYRADTLILVSAGKDGDFGTADDVFNFDKEVTE